jgi:C4-dicarboxylate transporter, DcuC family
MSGLVVAILVTAWLVYMVLTKYKPQAALLIAGVVLLIASIVLQRGPILGPKEATGSIWLDVFETIKNLTSARVGGFGLTIMAIAGFAKYMEHIQASKALYALIASPLKLIRSPSLLLVGAFFVNQVLALFYPSHTGLGLLLMATMYPILIRVGISPLSALAVIATNQFIDHGPGSQAEIYASTISGLHPAVYFVQYQLPVTIPIILAVAVTHYIVQPWWDKKEGYAIAALQTGGKGADESRPPLVYAFLPMIPLALIMGFSPVFKSPIKMDVTTAMYISTAIAMLFEVLRLRDVRAVLNSIQIFFKGMGDIFATVVSLIVSGEVYAAGLLKIGAVDTLIAAARDAGFGIHSMIIIMSLILAASAFLMGSGNAAFFSFGSLAPKVAAFLHVETVTLLLPMQIMVSFGRTVSPIAPPIYAIAAIAEQPPLQLVKRTAIPILVAAIVNIAANFIIFVK